MQHSKALAAIAILTMGLQGCAAVVIGGAAVGGLALAQERSVGQALDDNAIAAKISQQLLERDETLFAVIGTEVYEGRVMLVGVLADPAARDEAGRIAGSIPGVRGVINEIQLGGYDGQGVADYTRDAAIDKGAKARILAAVGPESVDYALEVVNSVVYIIGVAQSRDALLAAVHAARTTRGVRKVVSHVLLADDPRRGVGYRPHTH